MIKGRVWDGRCTDHIVLVLQYLLILVMDTAPRTTFSISKPHLFFFRDTLIEGVTSLWAAVCGGHLEVVQVLTKFGADVNSTTFGQSKSPMLRVACLEGISSGEDSYSADTLSFYFRLS